MQNTKDYFHFTQALWRRISESGLGLLYKKIPAINRWLQLFKQLAFLPLKYISYGYKNILQRPIINQLPDLNLKKNTKNKHQKKTIQLANKLIDYFIKYFESTWLNNI